MGGWRWPWAWLWHWRRAQTATMMREVDATLSGYQLHQARAERNLAYLEQQLALAGHAVPSQGQPLRLPTEPAAPLAVGMQERRSGTPDRRVRPRP